jgi:hypothetical protein
MSKVHHSRGDLMFPDSKSSIKNTFSAKAIACFASSVFLGGGLPIPPAGNDK